MTGKQEMGLETFQNVCEHKGHYLRSEIITGGEQSKMAIRWHDHIEERKHDMLGKPTFKGTRLTVEHILGEMGAGMDDGELLENYPTLRPEHIRQNGT